jgi:hypothetical protein
MLPRRAAASLFVLASFLSPAVADDRSERREREFWSPTDSEERAVQRAAERAAKAADTEGARWQRELAKAYPDKVGPGLTEADVGKWFDVLAGTGRDWRRDAAPTREVAELFDRAARRLELGPVPSLRRDEFLQYAKGHLVSQAQPQRQQKPEERTGDADRAFRVLDRDASGALEPGEWSDRLRADLKRADANGNRRIDATEYRAYFDGRLAEANEAAAKAATTAAKATPAARAGGLPAWFGMLDTDADGQVGLYEWRTAGRDVAEFMKMDLDGDGLLPPAEYLRYVRATEAEARAAEAAKDRDPPVVPPERRAGGRDRDEKRY